MPFDHSDALAEDWRIGENRYKTFTDPRNGRSYYYITIYSEYKGYSVTVMAENLNIGEMVLGENDQNDDSKIERYCYNNDTTKCDEFGGLYQWAEMMQLPSRCNTESCADLIQENHQGICPDGWRLFTYDDFCVVMGYEDKYDDVLHEGRYNMDIQLKRGFLEICVLAAIKNEDSYGYRIIKDLKPYIELSESTLYTILKRLESAKMLTVQTVEHDGRLRKYYHITEAGLQRIEEFKVEWKELISVYQFVIKEDDHE